ncbi:hypothetical protein HBH98_078610 [Parastagonospora nodorum]|nr:hypothetical protein HBH53_129950 [Parastagonospora nodorum]KAH3974995.1 hypothetical protein HBH51_084890 [Parastagonospora nodorum]KAH4001506.1 hypothetical protein HBI10_089680 [Parastagonospora nodorum]KAH4027411.1 hypothetical protein HBI13_058700 [Parastagonospora nodorum]KAH4348269.1 hypothetical protein HBH98_078610 [Parastagonospora nodorum]
MPPLAANSTKRELRSRTKKPSYTERLVGEDDIDGDEGESSEPVRPVKKSRTSKTASESTMQSSNEAPARVARQSVAKASSAIGASAFARSRSPEEASDSLTEQVDDDDPLWALVELEQQSEQDEFFDDEDDGGDEEFVPSIDDYVEEEELSGEAEAELEADILDLVTLQVHATAVHGVDENFRSILRTILVFLVAWASENIGQMQHLPRDQLAMTLGTASLLLRCDIDFVLNLFMSGIPLQVQQLFSKTSWCLGDFLSLPVVAFRDNRNGIYGNFATGNISRSNPIGCEVYVGQSVKVWKRMLQHLSIGLKYVVGLLPQQYARSLHYLCICRSGVQSNFRQLAAFDNGAEPGYLMLLETVFMILFGTFQKHGYTHRYATQASFDLIEEIRRELGIVRMPWKGMNAAIPILQGFRGPAQKPSPCSNADCHIITVPHNKRKSGPLGSPRGVRRLVNTSDPLGGYICCPCGMFLDLHGVLPGPNEIAKMERMRMSVQTRPKDIDPKCEDCGLRLSDDPSRKTLQKFSWIPGDGPIKGWHCKCCYEHVRLHGKHRPRTESGHLRTTKPHNEDEPCEHCGDPYKRLPSGEVRHARNRELQMMLCEACGRVYQKEGKLPGRKFVLLRQMKRLREDDATDEIKCSQCGISELECTTKRLHAPQEDGTILCPKCYQKKPKGK